MTNRGVLLFILVVAGVMIWALATGRMRPSQPSADLHSDSSSDIGSVGD